LLEEGLTARRLTFMTSNIEAIESAEFVFLALPTPSAPDGSADLTVLQTVVEELAPHLGERVLVLKSTVPVGTNHAVTARLRAADCTAPVVSNPEFLREGTALSDFLNPDHMVVGGDDPQAVAEVVALFDSGCPVTATDPMSAELVKYATNAYLATRVMMANSFADLCEVLGANIEAVTEGLGRDHRIGPHFLQPGPGFGGSCFPKDARALLDLADRHGLDFPILKAAVEVNAARQERMADQVMAAVDGVDDPVVALWGLAFKAGTDDTRESPALHIGESLARRGAVVRAYDPEATAADPIEMCESALAATDGAHVLVVATEWPQFAEVDPTEVATVMRGDLVMDLRNLLDAEQIRAAGLRLQGIGKPSS
ncbi:MAG: UDP-glucose/GDP-mannose dehydrogenase family protein, partial [Gemmatimonadales bacterium]|nr:UDP-glucose/GDP-mannose dehydrogenase family protein [Gemmatimonadales bacterium]